MIFTLSRRLLLAMWCLQWVTTADAQTLPDAGSVRQQMEPSRALPLPQAAPLQRDASPPEIQPSQGMTVRVKGFALAGNTLIRTETLNATLAEFIGRDLGFVDLQRAANAVAAAYSQAGWIARAYLPEQDVSEGTIALQVVEARFGGARFEGAPSQRIQSAQIAAFIAHQQATGAYLRTGPVDRALLLTDDLPGVSVAGTLVPGSAEGETALALQTDDEPLVYGDLSLDNTGARSTGSNRVTANLSINSPAGRGDLVNATALHTEGSDYGRIAYTWPYGFNGLRLGLNASELSYKVISGPGANSAARIEGHSDSLGLDWNYPMLRTRQANLYVTGGMELKNFYTRDTQLRSDYASQSLRLGLSGNRFDELGGGGANSASLQWGLGRLGSMQAHILKDTIELRYNKLNFSASRQQTITAAHSLLLSLQGQYATQILDSSEKFYIGGAGTVRAYPTSELGGERGQVLSAEWRWRLDSAWVLSAFTDHGQVVSLPLTANDQSTRLRLHGHGLSTSWQGPKGISARLTWSQRDGTNPKPTQTGTDGDGTLKTNRFWLSASMAF